jgi:pimeloyl-ACP methyl ester carboxylesterase
MCHGFPELWYSWRHQLSALSDAGFHAVAPDMRGYGQTDQPEGIDQYTMLHLVGDLVALLDALGEQTAVVIGHDWGAPVAWHAALLRPDRFRAVAGLSVPFRPRTPGTRLPSSTWAETDDALFYQSYFQEPGRAEPDLERDTATTTRRLLVSASAAGTSGPWRDADAVGMVPKQGGFVEAMPEPETLPGWLSEADVQYFAAEFARTGYRGGLNWYRNIDRNWELMAPYVGKSVEQPSLFVAGEQDLVLAFRGMDLLLKNLTRFLPGLTKSVILPDCGHWTQQEKPNEVNEALIEFLRGLG